MSRTWKITVIVLALAGIASTPLIWLLDSPDSGQLVGASVQGAVGIAALVWALFQSPAGQVEDVAVQTGEAEAEDGGTAVTGVKRPRGRGTGSAEARRTGRAKATGEGSRAVSGVDYE
ncbi:hypothetical protein [Streptomyces drozdowiczii]|uniref:Secreted protein n=1 Tax=Streptomyces drozdowiczii TaxID=202862 RepID=A0ABY6PRY8_9ACTN|nr:hypothetical protein [Streptomyces drozdowiczii]MCX0245360.1 hypothetical protein [Streptomyces drozdowiczii]UZK54993.1 hypothetical protein NEH16_13355 [Streptomyces drozdowiczii]